VQALQIIEEAKGEVAPSTHPADRPEWELAYLAAETPLQFEVRLPPTEEYTPTFKFKGDDGGFMPTKTGLQGGKLVSWVAAAPKRLIPAVAKHVGHAYVGSKIAEECGFKGFVLPNGKTLRLFHASTKRNWKAPAVEPDEPQPETLTALGLPSMPPNPPPPQPSKRDLPKLVQTEVRAMRLKPETKKGASGSSAISTAYVSLMEEERFVMTAHTPEAMPSGAMAGVSSLLGGKPDVTLPLFESVFAPRRLTSDSRTFFDDGNVTLRAFEIDFARCNQERFRLLIQQEDDDTAALVATGNEVDAAGASESVEIAEIKDVLCRHRDVIYRCFQYYAALGAINERGDGYSIGIEDYEAFFRKCRLHDEKSPACKAADLLDIFHTTNEEEGTGLKEDSEMNAVNADKALLRFEFLQCLVRVAIAKYVHAGQTLRRRSSSSKQIADVSEALEELLVSNIVPNLPAEANVISDQFREKRLYRRDMHAALEEKEMPLSAIFDFYASSIDEPETDKPKIGGVDSFAQDLHMNINEWLALCEDSKLLDKDFTRHSAVLCFVWSQPFVTDEARKRDKMSNLSYVDFLEALSRILTFKPLPSQELLKQYEAKSAAHFFEQVVNGEHEGHEDMRRPITWKDDGGVATANVSLRQPLDMLISLIFENLSTTDGTLTRKDLRRRLQARAEAKREAAAEARAAEEETPRMFGAVADVLMSKTLA